jgi:plastocyanin
MSKIRSRFVLLVVGLGISLPLGAAQISALVRDANGRPLPDAVVVAIPESGAPPAAVSKLIVIDQIGKEFVPYVMPVRTGTSVQFPNKDNVQHHVYSFSAPKQFELPLYRGKPAKAVLFDKPGLVKIGCNIHDWMIGYIYITDSPYFEKTSENGTASLDLPPGVRYRVHVWHPRMVDTEDTTVQAADLRESTNASLEWKLKLKAEFRPPRTPLPGEPGYR